MSIMIHAYYNSQVVMRDVVHGPVDIKIKDCSKYQATQAKIVNTIAKDAMGILDYFSRDNG